MVLAFFSELVFNSYFLAQITRSKHRIYFYTVIDYATGKPIENVNVKLNPTGETTLTVNNGTYEFMDLAADKYSFHLSNAEYVYLDDLAEWHY